MSMSSHLLQRGIAFWKSGDKKQARTIFKTIIYNDDGNESAWFWYVYALETNKEKIAALETFLASAPGNEMATKALATLRSQQTDIAETEQATLPVEAAPIQDKPAEIHTIIRPAQTIRPVAQKPKAAPRPVSSYKPQAPQVKNKAGIVIPGVLAFFGICCLLLGASLGFIKYSILETDYQTEKTARQEISTKFDQLNLDYQNLDNRFNTVVQQYKTLDANYTSLQNDRKKLQDAFDTLQGEHQNLQLSYNSLQTDYGNSINSYNELKDKAIVPPYIYIRGRDVHLSFLTPDQQTYNWNVPFDLLETDLQRGNLERNRIRSDGKYPHLLLDNTGTGETYNAIDYRGFVDPWVFEKFSRYFYDRAPNEEVFIQEIWYIVAQLTSYSKELRDTPRFPLETLLAGGGDCEDHAILFASMILAAAPDNWTVDLVYMDGDNPTNPQTMNHLIVYIDTGNRTYTVEATGKDVMEPYTDGVNGWYYEISH